MDVLNHDPRRFRLRNFPQLLRARSDAQVRRATAAEPDMTYLFWECTRRCNLRCAHCGSSCEGRSPGHELSTQEVCDALDTIAQDFDASRIFVSITGGEPLVRKDLYQVVRHMTDLGMRTCIVSNGTLLGPEQAKALYDAGMRTASISIDGARGSHEAVRGADTWHKSVQALRNAREAGFEVVEAITCVRPANLQELPSLEPVFKEAGANLWRLITIDKMGRAKDADAEIWLNPPQIRQLLQFVADRRAKRRPGDLGVSFSCGGFLGLEVELAVRQRHNQCGAGLTAASILHDGRVSACPSLPDSWAQGSIRERRFSEIWRDRFEKHRSFDWRREGSCGDCDWFGACLGGGLHERLVQPDDHCWLERIGCGVGASA